MRKVGFNITRQARRMTRRKVLRLAIAGVVVGAGTAMARMSMAQMSHHHGAESDPKCTDASLACAMKATPAFAADGTLWLTWAAHGIVSVAHSSDRGRTFSPPVAVNRDPLDLDWGPDARPKIAIDRDGRVFVAFARFKDQKFNGQVLYSRSTDGGRSFAPPAPITANSASQRFETLALDADGSLFAAWLDKRDGVAAAERNEKYVGAGLAFAWSRDHGASFSEARIAVDNTCECCRLAVAFAGAGRPVVAFRNVFGGTVRDHAVVTFSGPQIPGPLNRISVDDWKTDVCPHQGPTLAVAADGSYHVAWFTDGSVRKGLFYASSVDGGRTFSQPMPFGNPEKNAARPFLLAANDALWLTWKEFDGEHTTVQAMVSRDAGRTWSAPRTMAQTGGPSDHPLLVTNGAQTSLSWQTRAEGYRLLPLETTQ
jgi:hypothetical protein